MSREFRTSVNNNTTSPNANDSVRLRVMCLLGCLPSIGALLAKVYGLASMQLVAVVVMVPCCTGLVAIWMWARRARKKYLYEALTLGFLGGLFGSFCYDLARVPFQMLFGMRVFMPISAFGMLLAEANASSRATEVLGWLYHYSNGVTFGIMYALFLRGRHWGWAIVWAFMLETIAVASPFARIFGLVGNYRAIGVAYWGHVAYGLPLGLMIYQWDETRDWLSSVPASTKWTGAVLSGAAALWPLFTPTDARQDVKAARAKFIIEGRRLNPDILRIRRGQMIEVFNPDSKPVSLLLKDTGKRAQIARGKKGSFAFPRAGVYQIFVETTQRTRSSFVMVEPIEEGD
jgi:hypothetical protein